MKNYEEMTKEELAAEAERRGLEVKRTDGGDGEPRKSDYVAALTENDESQTGDEPKQPENGTRSGPTPRAKIIGRMLASGELEPNAPVTWGQLSRIMDMAEDNAHGHAARAEHDAEWEARASRRRRAGVGKESGARSLEGNADTRADANFSDMPTPEQGETQDFFITRKKPEGR